MSDTGSETLSSCEIDPYIEQRYGFVCIKVKQYALNVLC